MYKRIVVALDGSELAEAVLPVVRQLAGPLDLEVIVVRVIQPRMLPVVTDPPAPAVVDDVAERLTAARRYLMRIADALAGSAIRVRVDVRRGDPVREIIAAARETDADLIAMSTHGRSGLGRLLFGSVAEAVLRQAEIPVLLIRLTERPVSASVAGAGA